MSSRDKILNAIAAGKPSLIALPEMPAPTARVAGEQIEKFIQTLTGIGGQLRQVQNISEVAADLAKAKASGNYIVNTIAALGEVNKEIDTRTGAQTLEPVDRAYLAGTLGVAENGAVWLYESQLINRLLPFICQHLVICLNANSIVPTMHHAYAQIRVDREGYGVFLAGPSKTADIEQSLVIGAHGARSLLVFLINDPF